MKLHPLFFDSPTTRNTSKVGIQGVQTKETAVACLTACPLLEDMMEWSHWSLVFQPQLGCLRDFIEKYGGLNEIFLEGLFLCVNVVVCQLRM